MITVTIPNWYPTSANKLMNAHFGERIKLKKSTRNLLHCYMNHLPKATGKRRVSLCVTYMDARNKLDPDNYFKDLLDGLTACGMLVDDCDKYCEIAPVKFMRGEPATIIQLEDI